MVDCVGANCGVSEDSCTNPVRGTTVQLVQWAGHTKQEKGLWVWFGSLSLMTRQGCESFVTVLDLAVYTVLN